MNSYTYGEIEVGQSASFEKTITKEDILLFSKLTGDKNPLHVDEEYAKQTKFKKPVAFGLLISSLWSTIAGMHLPGKHSLILSVQSSFRKPCFVGDTLTVEGVVRQKVDVGSILVLGLSVKNQTRAIVADGEMKVQVLK